MVLRMKGNLCIEADRETIWAALHDVTCLKPCVPGCTKLERVSPTRFDLAACIPFGVITIPFSGRIETGGSEPPRVLRLSAEGGGIAGAARGSAAIILAETPSGCRLSYEAVYAPSGPLAIFGTFFLSGLMQMLTDQFASDFAARIPRQRPGAGGA